MLDAPTTPVSAGRQRFVFGVFMILMAAVVIAGSISYGRATQLAADRPSMVSKKDLARLQVIDGCTVGRPNGFLSFVCPGPKDHREPTPAQREAMRAMLRSLPQPGSVR
jgi:hypothetical protein